MEAQMSFKELLVVVDDSKHCRSRIRVASVLARRFEAHLTGLYVAPSKGVSPFLADQYAPEKLEAAQTATTQRLEDAAAMFGEETKAVGVDAEWHEARGSIAELAIWHGRHADLTILGQLDPAETTGTTGAIAPDRVVLETGRPALIVPYAGTFDGIGTRVLVAWNASPQAARAVSDALPLLARAKHVTVLTVDPFTVLTAPGEDTQSSETILLRRLARHGIKAEPQGVPPGELHPADMLLSSAADAGADLIVMGIFGHSRLRELVFGGISRNMLGHMTMPLFVAH
jgi:nucleotide-binding universal stress UspA family protein